MELFNGLFINSASESAHQLVDVTTNQKLRSSLLSLLNKGLHVTTDSTTLLAKSVVSSRPGMYSIY